MYTEKYRTGLKRLWAAIVDGIFFMPLLLVEQWIYKTTNNVPILFIWVTIISFAPLFYSVIFHYKTGQTIGKWVAGIKVADISEARNITLRQSIFRDGFYVVVALAGLVYYSFLLFYSDNKIEILSDYSSFSDIPVILWALIELITMLTNSKRRAIHDFMAKSIVVRVDSSK